MRFWFVHSGEVSLREQICTQITLGIACGELRAGQRLPSTREMARRFGLHPNTVSGAYSQLHEEGIVERRRGSGVYVRAPQTTPKDDARQALDRMIAGFLTAARAQGFTMDHRHRARPPLDGGPAPRSLPRHRSRGRAPGLFSPRLRPALNLPVRGCSTSSSARRPPAAIRCRPAQQGRDGAGRAARPHRAGHATDHQRPRQKCTNGLPVPVDALIGIVSRWPGFVQIAKTMLVATGFNPDAMTFERIRGRSRLGRRSRHHRCRRLRCRHRAVPARASVCGDISPGLRHCTLDELRSIEESIRLRLGTN